MRKSGLINKYQLIIWAELWEIFTSYILPSSCFFIFYYYIINFYKPIFISVMGRGGTRSHSLQSGRAMIHCLHSWCLNLSPDVPNSIPQLPWGHFLGAPTSPIFLRSFLATKEEEMKKFTTRWEKKMKEKIHLNISLAWNDVAPMIYR